jgi:sulfopyruvate decarboxylase subunit beta
VTGTDLAGVARSCAIPLVTEADTPERLKQAVADALAGETLTTIVSKVEAIGPKSFRMDLPLLENRFQFKRALEALRQRE